MDSYLNHKILDFKKLCFTSLAHHITQEQLAASLKRIPRDSSAGVDGQSVEAAREQFAHWSEEMIDAMHRGGYQPPPARRVYLPKPGKDAENGNDYQERVIPPTQLANARNNAYEYDGYM